MYNAIFNELFLINGKVIHLFLINGKVIDEDIIFTVHNNESYRYVPVELHFFQMEQRLCRNNHLKVH